MKTSLLSSKNLLYYKPSVAPVQVSFPTISNIKTVHKVLILLVRLEMLQVDQPFINTISKEKELRKNVIAATRLLKTWQE